MEEDEFMRVSLAKVARVALTQLALIEDPIDAAILGYAGGTEPVMVLKVEHKAGSEPGEPIHLAIPLAIAALTVGQFEAMAQTSLNQEDRELYEKTRDLTRDMCLNHPCARGCSDPAAHAEGAHDV